MSEWSTNPNKGKSNPYLDILHRRYISDSKDCKTLMDLDTRAQIIALQNAQVKQAIEAEKTNSIINNIQAMLEQLINKPTRLLA